LQRVIALRGSPAEMVPGFATDSRRLYRHRPAPGAFS